MPDTNPELRRIHAFMLDFARRQAGRTIALPGAFAVRDDAYAHSRANNQVVVAGGAVDPGALPALADEALGDLPYRMVSVLDDAAGAACADPLARAGYRHGTYVVMLHSGPVRAAAREAEVVDLEAIGRPLTRSWHGFLPDAGEDVVRQLVERRAARRRGAAAVHIVGSRAEDGEVASWADLYLDPASGVAQVEDLVTAADRLGRGHADAVLATALRLAVDAGCRTRFLTADAADWPRHWYARRGFTEIGRMHVFDRVGE
ncbi:GNAT family N-acetyltransferase [Streptosporangium nondiastaticum]|uniref:GNAT family N-acetyltransferase n=1 Tax=Streptosporangium nondiastaticum TaxID=35764 RepID=A0A9X7JKF1_9ACTN|nr:GNAT family N-acetyltransferase [Streptosporangium nondiastaticum]PSJ25064.1 GNAT family N-acetyltransferase [Streptosporangium nondiastaticum]